MPPSPLRGGKAGAERRQGGGVRRVNDRLARASAHRPDSPTLTASRSVPPHEGEGDYCLAISASPMVSPSRDWPSSMAAGRRGQGAVKRGCVRRSRRDVAEPIAAQGASVLIEF